ncbi:hypothetical protein [Aeromicrobium sp. 179-A 4D2 NHS]|uniref:hypothetical protein n=1 Tax=Aeromicrobium sp. 179-A 4D2 NHS TaxID=3142375 RepID=UPI0039A0A6BE
MCRPFAVTIATLALLAGCGGSEAPFSERDPEGYKACSMFAETHASKDMEVKIGGLLTSGEQARKAGTKAIRESAEAVFDEDAMDALKGTENEGNDFPMVDADKLKKACSNEGFEF